jgi:Holliday junction DNA helicase RuvA
MALALLDTLGETELVQAVISGNTRLLASNPWCWQQNSRTSGPGTKNKLQDWQATAGISLVPGWRPHSFYPRRGSHNPGSFGLYPTEITKALQAVGRHATLQKSADPEAWVREAIAWLSQ